MTPTPATAALLAHRFKDVELPAPAGSANPYVSGAAWFAYAPWDTSFYIASGTSSVDVVQAGNYTVSATIPVGSDPFGVAVDPNTKQVFVTNSGSGNVSILSGTSAKVLGNITVQKDPQGIAYDASNRTLYVANNQSGTVSVISVASDSVLTNVTVGSNPVGVAWDNATDRVFVADSGSNTVSAIGTSNNQVLATIPVGSNPDGVAVDNATDSIYVTNEESSNISVLNASTLSVKATIPVVDTDGLQGIAYDSRNGLIWVAGGYNFAIVVNTSTESVIDYLLVDPSGVVYDPTNGDVCFTNSLNATFTCTVFSTSLAQDYAAAVADFSESGLATGAKWNVTLYSYARQNATQTSTSPTVRFGVYRGFSFAPGYNYTYTVGAPAGYLPSPPSGYDFSPKGNNTSVSIAFSSHGVYVVTFTETGLPAGTTWSVTISGTTESATGPSIRFSEKNGSYAYTVGHLNGWVASTSAGNLTVAGRSVNLTLSWSQTSTYPVTFFEGGLPSGTDWSVTLAGSSVASTGTTIVFHEPNGTYSYSIPGMTGWTASTTQGSLTVSGGPVNLSVSWSHVGSYPVDFKEQGLPNGTGWAVSVGSAAYSTTLTTIQFNESNGSYHYQIQRAFGWSAVPSNGTFSVAGAPLTIDVQWSQIVTYSITFTETGLPNGTLWNVSLPGSVTPYTDLGSTGTSVTFTEPNATYAYAVATLTAYSLPEYLPTPASGNVTVRGGSVGVHVDFSLGPGFFPVTFSENGLPHGASWSIALASVGSRSSSPTIVLPELNGSYSYTAGGASGYAPVTPSGTFAVRGLPLTVPVPFRLAPGFYDVSFNETGLGAGTPWSVELNGTVESSTGSSIGFAEANGSYRYVMGTPLGYVVAPSNGTVTVNGASPPTIRLTFTSTDLYTITFHESGLPSGTGWAALIGSSLESSLTPNVTLKEPNGTYGYLILPVPGFTTSGSGFVTVPAANVTVNVPFSPQTFPVVVIEYGLPNGTTWSVTASNSSTGYNATYTTTGSALVFDLPNGTYALTVHAGGYSANISSPTFTVAGKLLGVSPTVRFARLGTPPTASSSTPGLLLEVAGAIVSALMLGGIGVGLLLRRRSEREDGERWVRELTESGPSLGPRERP